MVNVKLAVTQTRNTSKKTAKVILVRVMKILAAEETTGTRGRILNVPQKNQDGKTYGCTKQGARAETRVHAFKHELVDAPIQHYAQKKRERTFTKKKHGQRETCGCTGKLYDWDRENLRCSENNEYA